MALQEGGGSPVRTPQLATRSVRILAVPLLLAGVAAGVAPAALPAAAQAKSRVPSSFVPAPGQFYGVAATSARNAWAVGYTAGETSATLIAHWNGKAWKRVPSPNPGSSSRLLQGVAATSATNAWAVGYAGSGTLILHWNGKTWKRVPSPNPGSIENGLYGVAATSATNAWAVGYAESTGPTTTTLILHWNGKTWKRVPSPSPSDPELYGVTAASAKNAWAVGYSAVYSEGFKTLTLHWNGKVWKRVPSPNPVKVSSSELTWNILQGVAATSANNVWAVGWTETHFVGPKTMILHWNGKAWKKAPSPNPYCATCDSLYGVAATSASNAWAVGTLNSDAELVVLRWNGTNWKNSPVPFGS